MLARIPDGDLLPGIRNCLARLGRGETAGTDEDLDALTLLAGEQPTTLRQLSAEALRG